MDPRGANGKKTWFVPDDGEKKQHQSVKLLPKEKEAVIFLSQQQGISQSAWCRQAIVNAIAQSDYEL
ncbi:MAG: hypothetical protein F6J93_26335 [Oscillatoria sp. SIO1A7]|nr:hypothetical protein [Oscillatoria sp. SIO1A7]